MLGAQEKRACIAAGPFSMADSGGFEPPTARFVAEYSIQLSYESVTDHSKATALGYASLKPNS